MGCVIVIAVHRARADHADGAVGRTGLHGTSLYRRGLGPHEEFIGQIERVLHVAGRMILRQVQGLKVKIIVFDFRAFGDFKAHAHEDLFDLTQGERHRMQMPFGCLRPGKVTSIFSDAIFFSSWRLQAVSFGQQCGFHLAAHFIHHFAHFWTFFGGYTAETAQDFGQGAFFAQILHTDVLQVIHTFDFA